MPIDNHGDGWAQTLTLTQTISHAWIPFVQIVDHLPDSFALYRESPLTVRKITQ
jgi:hypothetical protein